jgi:hypothetical protein
MAMRAGHGIAVWADARRFHQRLDFVASHDGMKLSR